MEPEDIAGKFHWDTVYSKVPTSAEIWEPKGYTDLCIEHILLAEIERRMPSSILEVGCGNSTWLPYLARKTGAKVTGIDYSEQGAELARKRLSNAGVEGEIICGDIFTLDTSAIGSFDFVYSLGLVEHFSELKPVVSKLAEFTAEKGTLLTEVPNLLSVHGLLAYLYQPNLLSKHKAVSKKQLEKCYQELGLSGVVAKHLGTFSLGIVAWGIEQRFPRLDVVILPVVKVLLRVTEEVISRLKSYKGCPLFAPFVYIRGIKSQESDRYAK